MYTSLIKAFEKVTVHEKPFTHFVVPNLLGSKTRTALINWFEEEAPWRPRHEDFYDSFNMNLREAHLPKNLSFLIEYSYLNVVRGQMEKIFSTKLASKIDVAGQKMIHGYRLGIHTDFIPEQQCYSHRLLIQLNRGWTVENGGLLILLDHENPSPESKTHKYYLPYNSSGYGFEISPRSFHAVSPVRHGERYTLCFSFYRESSL